MKWHNIKVNNYCSNTLTPNILNHSAQVSKYIRSNSLGYKNQQYKINKKIVQEDQKINQIKKRLKERILKEQNKQNMSSQNQKQIKFRFATTSTYVSREKQKKKKIQDFVQSYKQNVNFISELKDKIIASHFQFQNTNQYEYLPENKKFMKKKCQKSKINEIQIQGQKPKWLEFQHQKLIQAKGIHKLKIKHIKNKKSL